MKEKMNYAVAHELVAFDAETGDLHCFEMGYRDYQVSARILDEVEETTFKTILVSASRPSEALAMALATGELDHLDFEAASDTLILHVCRRAN